MRKEVVGTTAIARICRCSPRLVCRWIDDGTLRGFHVPASKVRRVQRVDLIAFLRQHNFPAKWIAEAEVEGAE